MHEVSDPAGFWIRVGSDILDTLLILVGINFLLSLLLGIPLGSESWLLLLLQFVYWVVLPVLWSGYTVGKSACGIRIVRMDGSDVRIGTMLIRQLVKGLGYTLTFGIGLIVSATMVAAREDKRSLHDFAAGTYVTYDAPTKNNND